MTKRYRVLVELLYPTDPAIIARLQAGENVPWPECGRKRAHVGDIVSDLPAYYIPTALAKGRIEAVPDEPTPAPTPKRRSPAAEPDEVAQ